MKLRKLLLVSLLGLAASTAFGATPSADAVLVLGDSLSAAHNMPETSGWVALLEARARRLDRSSPSIVNASHGGKSLVDGIAELPALLAAHHPAAVIIELGGNDALQGVPEATLEKQLVDLIRLAQSAHARVVVLGFAVPAAFDSHGSADNLRRAYAAAAASTGATLLPSLLDGISSNPELLQKDGIHPTEAAQPKVLANAWPALEPLL